MTNNLGSPLYRGAVPGNYADVNRPRIDPNLKSYNPGQNVDFKFNFANRRDEYGRLTDEQGNALYEWEAPTYQSAMAKQYSNESKNKPMTGVVNQDDFVPKQQWQQRSFDSFNWDNIHSTEIDELKNRLNNLENEKADIEKRIPQLEAAIEDMKRSRADRLAENRMGRWRKDNTGMEQWNKNKELEARQTQNAELMRIENRTQYDNKVQQLFETYGKAKAEDWTDSQLKVLESQFANLQKSAIINGIIDPSEQLSLSGQMDPELAAQEAVKAARTEKLNKIKARIQLIGSDDNEIMKLRNEIGNDPELIDEAATLLAMPELQTSKMIKDKQKKQGGAKAVQTLQDIASEQTKKAVAEQELKNKASKYNGKKLNSLEWSQIPDDVKQYLTINGRGIVSLKG